MLVDKVLKFVNENCLIEKGDRIVLGVSGGADSVALLRVLIKLQEYISFRIIVVHINHGVRDSEADRDQKFVESLCKDCGVQCVVESFDVPKIAKETKTTVEEAGRNIRYQTFRQIMNQEGYNKIAVAHNHNDNVETVLFNALRGTGIAGLTGIKQKTNNIIRPLLNVRREGIESYLKEINQDYCVDSTNLDNEYMRNKIRLELIPYMEKNINVKAAEHIFNMSSQLNEINEYLNGQADEAFEKCIEIKDDIVIVDDIFNTFDIVIKKIIIRNIIYKLAGKLKDISSVNIESVIELCNKQVGKEIQLPYGIVARKCYTGLQVHIQRENELDVISQETVIVPTKEWQSYIDNNGVTVRVKIMSNRKNIKFSQKMYTKWLDYDKIENNVIMRKRTSGDFIQVNSEGGTKKIKDYFIDQKINAKDRDKITLFTDDKHTIWVVGYRISERYKIADNTKNILVIEYGREDIDG